MTTPWERVDRLLAKKKRSWASLAASLGFDKHTDQVVSNWKVRGIPLKHYEAMAVEIQESMGWIAGIEPPRSEDPSKFTPMARKLAQQFDTIPDQDSQLDAFAKIMTIITKSGGGS